MNPQRRQKGLTKALKAYNSMFSGMQFDPQFKERQIRLLFKTRKLCSCSMCGNPRRYFNELTMQEKKRLLNFQDELKDLSKTA